MFISDVVHNCKKHTVTQFIIRNILIFGFAVLLAFLIDYKKSIKYWYVLLLFIAIGLVDNLLHITTELYPQVQIIKYHTWNNALGCNWSAKLYSVVFALILLIPLNRLITSDEIGLRFHQNSNSIQFSLLGVLLFFVSSTFFGFLNPKGPFDVNTLLYEAIMPGLNEEIIYRGFLLVLLNKLFERKFKLLKTSFGWGAILTSIVFGILHGFRLTDTYHFQFDFLIIIGTGLNGFIFALIKERSGSLVFPIIAHNTSNFFLFLIRMI